MLFVQVGCAPRWFVQFEAGEILGKEAGSRGFYSVGFIKYNVMKRLTGLSVS